MILFPPVLHERTIDRIGTRDLGTCWSGDFSIGAIVALDVPVGRSRLIFQDAQIDAVVAAVRIAIAPGLNTVRLSNISHRICM